MRSRSKLVQSFLKFYPLWIQGNHEYFLFPTRGIYVFCKLIRSLAGKTRQKKLSRCDLAFLNNYIGNFYKKKNYISWIKSVFLKGNKRTWNFKYYRIKVFVFLVISFTNKSLSN